MKHPLFVVLLCLFAAAVARAQSAAERWQADIAFLKTELPKRHPKPYARYSQKAFENELAKLNANLNGRSDLDIALELQRILANLGDANTRLDLAPLLQQDKVIPLGLGWYEGGLYVSGTVRKFAPALGKKVLAINGIPTEEALDKIGRFVARENKESVRKDGPQWLRFPSALRAAGIANSDTMTLLLEDEKGQRGAFKTFPLDFKRDKNLMQPAQFVPKSPDFRWDPNKQIFNLVWLDSTKIAYVQYNACFSQEMVLATGDSLGATQLPSFQPLADSLVRLLELYPNARFFFDLRFNNAGIPTDGIALAKRLAALPAANRPERLYVAVNRYTGGAALEIAAAFRTLTKATLLGEVPAQRPNHFGDPKSFPLPNSKILVYHGSRAVQTVSGNPDTLSLQAPVELPFDAFRQGRDPLLDYVRQR